MVKINISSQLVQLILEKIVEEINNTRYYRDKSNPYVNISWAQRTIRQLERIARWGVYRLRDEEFKNVIYELNKIKNELDFYIMEEGKRARREENSADEILIIQDDILCPFCGTHLEPNSNFCRSCGTELLGHFTFSN